MNHQDKIFGIWAEPYYAAGLPVIPLYKREKKPIPQDWSRYFDHPVEPEQQAQWISAYPDANMGIVLGEQSGLAMLDIDTDDQTLNNIINQLIPQSPWERIGAKGRVFAFKYNGVRTFRIKNTSGETLCEYLSTRTQVVLPPSIHPTTQKPYHANCELLDVLDNLPSLPTDIEQQLRKAFEDAGVTLSHTGYSRVTEFASSGSRDTSLTEKAGLFAYAVMRGERTLKESIGMLRAYAADFVERVAGDDMDVEKHVSNLIKFLQRDVNDKSKVLPSGWDEDMTPEEKKTYGLEFTSDDEEWTFEQLRDFLRDEFERYPKQSTGRDKAVDRALAKIAVSSCLSKLEEDRIFDYIVSTAGMGVKLSSLRAQVRDLRMGQITGSDQSEIARHALADLEMIHPVRLYDGFVWKWAGSHWEKLDDDIVLQKISQDYGSLAACKRFNDLKGVYAIMKLMMSKGIKSNDLKGVNFANGFLTEDLKLIQHDKDFGMTYTMPFRYMPELAGKHDLFSSFLHTSWGQDDDFNLKVEALQEALCATLFGLAPKFQRAFLLQGAAKSGKSQLLKIASSLVPDGARSAVPPHDWADKFLPTAMHNKLINVAGELSEKKLIDGQRFKDIIDGTEMSGQMKGGQIFHFTPVCAQWFASNHAPRTEDTSEGFNRRWLVFQFNHPIKASERRLDLGDMIVVEEREAIVAWAVCAMSRLRANNDYTLPPSHKQVMREVANMNNSVRFFLTESGKVRVVPLQLVQPGQEKTSSLTSASETKLFQAYWSFCVGPGSAKPVSLNQFRAKMRELGSEHGFRIMIRDTGMGGQEATYENLMLATGVATSNSKAQPSGAKPTADSTEQN